MWYSSKFNVIVNCPDKTGTCKWRSDRYEYFPQKEKDLEEELIKVLQDQGYEYLPKFREQDLEGNLKRQLERLNGQRIKDFRFTHNEWHRFFNEHIIGSGNQGIEAKNRKIQGDENIKSLIRDDGSILNICLFDREEPQRNHLQVINQFTDLQSKSRYDVNILVNGLPMIHIELKRNTVNIEDAFHQNARYQLESLHGLFEFTQIFIISNGKNTRYYSNTTKYKEDKNSFLFTSHWACAHNEAINNLIDFAQTFLNRRNVLEILSKYCVLDSANELKVLRPYQIAAIEAILNKIHFSIHSRLPADESGGYIWHTTGSGKTLTSFKAAQLALRIEEVKKVLFVVDRKDLDAQTCQEYKKFSGESPEQSIDETHNTAALTRLLCDREKRIIVTTIQKLRRLLEDESRETKQKLHHICEHERVVIIMDECHRSQTLSAHKLIRSFKKRNVFGFTGTPIFKESKSNAHLTKTQSIFGDKLHQYCIVDAIHDKNVLPFYVEYTEDRVRTPRVIDPEDKTRIAAVVRYIIKHFKTKTSPSAMGVEEHTPKRFNSMLAVESINSAMLYYDEFQRQLTESDDIHVAVIFSAYQDEENSNENCKDTDLPENQREFLDRVMKSCTWSKSNKFSSFENYRSGVAEGVKNKTIDILIVVNMFLTGFDAPTLNTLWVDKPLKEHGLIQAFSRTNRIFDKTKQHGNIVCFRPMQPELDEAVQLFAGGHCIFIKGFEERAKQFQELEERLKREFPLGQELNGWEEKEAFVELYKEYHQISQGLSSDDRFHSLRSLRIQELQDYKGMYLKIHEEYKRASEVDASETRVEGAKPVKIPLDDFCWEFESFQSDEIGKDYILNVLATYWKDKDRDAVLRIIRASMALRKEEGLMVEYMDYVDQGHQDAEYMDFKKHKFASAVDQMIRENNLERETKDVMEEWIDSGRVSWSGSRAKNRVFKKVNLINKWEEYKATVEKVKFEVSRLFDLFQDLKKWSDSKKNGPEHESESENKEPYNS